MLTLSGSRAAYCDGVSRRNFLKVGTLGFGGFGLADLLRLRAEAGASLNIPKSVILICLPGGPSHIDMYDMKPDAPAEYRGEFRPISTNLPGLDICEHMPLQTKIADKFAVVRNLTFTQGDHQMQEVYTAFPAAPNAPFLSPPIRPAVGSIISKLRSGERSLLPNYISLGGSDFYNVAAAEVPMYLGPAHAPFEPKGEVVGNLELKKEVGLNRFGDRQSLRRTFDQLRQDLDATNQLEAVDYYNAKAVDMLTSPAVRKAFDIEEESPETRALYGPDTKFKWTYQAGHTWHASRFLLARRLAEAGVPFITLTEGGWDDHGKVNDASPAGNVFERLREKLPAYDRSIYALITDLYQRGLDKDVAVVVWGEFGRTPRVNFAGGRDHWPRAGFALFSGGGFRTGQVIGQTDARAERPISKAYTPQNVFATLYHFLGIDPDQSTYRHPSGRPMHLLDDTARITELA